MTKTKKRAILFALQDLKDSVIWIGFIFSIVFLVLFLFGQIDFVPIVF